MSKYFSVPIIHFVVFNSSDTDGVTDKLTLESYIFLNPKQIIIRSKFEKQQNMIIEKILFSSYLIKTIYNELNKYFFNIIYFHNNGNIHIDTNIREDLGKYIEIILFGDKMDNINLKQALYILNEENYSKNIFKFKQDFKNLYFPN